MSLITNKKARFNYEIGDTYNAGMELFGFEVKSLRKSLGSLEGAYVTVRGNEAFLVNAFILKVGNLDNRLSVNFNPAASQHAVSRG